MLTKQEIIRWYHTSVLPSEGTEELNKFMLDVAIKYDGINNVGHKNFPRAMKAFKKYGFNDADIKKMYPSFNP